MLTFYLSSMRVPHSGSVLGLSDKSQIDTNSVESSRVANGLDAKDGHYIKRLVLDVNKFFILLILISISLFLPNTVFSQTSTSTYPLSSLAVYVNGTDRLSNFSTNTFTYSVSVDAATEQIQLIANLTDSSSSYTVTVEPESISTTGTHGVPLDIQLSSTGETDITVAVTEQSGTTLSYTVSIVAKGICGRVHRVAITIVNSIQEISDCANVTATHLNNISDLDLSGLFIGGLQNGSFAGLNNLQTLGLNRNKLTSLPSDIFSNLNNLSELRLDFNELTSLPPGSFSGVNNLQFLRLNSNKLTSLPADIFSNLNNLQNLYLNHNELISLPSDIFSNLNNLRDLALYGNELTSLSVGSFSGLNNLINVCLSDNELTGLPPGIFSNLNNLQIVCLSYNKLTSLPAEIFSGVNDLQFLFLSNNELTSLPAEIFSGLGDTLHTLDLSNNNQMNLPITIFSNLGTIPIGSVVNVNLSIMEGLSPLTIPAGIFSGVRQRFIVDLNGNSSIIKYIHPKLGGINVFGANTTDPVILLKGVERQVEVSLETPLSVGSFSATAVSTNSNITLTPSRFNWTANGENNQILNITGGEAGSAGIFFQYDMSEVSSEASVPLLETDSFLFKIIQPIIIVNNLSITFQDFEDLTIQEGITQRVTIQLVGQDKEVNLYTPPNFGISLSTTTVTLVGGVTETVTIDVADDNIYHPDRQSTLTVSAGLNIEAAIIPVRIEDNDTLTFSISNIGSLTEGEQGALMVSVNALPELEEINVVIQAESGLEISQTQIRFTTEYTTQSIQVTATDTRLSEGDRERSITVSASGYSTVHEMITIIDDDNLILVTTPREIVLKEGEGSQALAIQIYAQVPERTTTVHIMTHAVDVISISSETIIVQGEEIKTITIDVADDNIYHPDRQSTLTVSAGLNIEAAIIPVRIEDNDTLTFSISDIGSLTEGEQGELMVSINSISATMQEVIVQVDSDTAIEVIPSTLSFTTLNPQAITISAVNDDIVSGDRESRLIISADNYISEVANIDISENDTLTLTVRAETVLLEDSENGFVIAEGSTRTFIVSLGGLPIRSYTEIIINNESTSRLSVDKDSLVFDSLSEIKINISAKENIIIDLNNNSTLTLTSIDGYADKILMFLIQDDDAGKIRLRVKAYIEGSMQQP